MTWLPEWENWFEAITAIVELLAAMVVLLGIPFAALKFFQQRKDSAKAQVKEHTESLRLGEVLVWGHHCIDVLQRIVLLTAPDRRPAAGDAQQLDELALRASVLTEQGRTWFKNRTETTHGKEKPQAYRGLRPLILDYVLAGHQAARDWPEADAATRPRINTAVSRAAQLFVSLLQMETAREQTKDRETAASGSDAPLARLLSGARR